MVKFRSISFNANGLHDGQKRREVFRFLKSKNVQIILLQETHCIQSMEKVWKAEWGGKIYFSNGSSNSRGVAILFCNKFDFTVHDVKKDSEGRALVLDITVEDTRFR